MHSPYPLSRDIVLVGGGHAHALVLHKWAMQPLAGVRLTVINPAPTAPYTGMLPGHIAGHYPRAALEIDLIRLARRAGARVVLDRAVGLDQGARQVHLAGRPPLVYDVVSLDIGITSDLPMVPGYLDHAVSAKPLGAYAALWAAWIAQAESRAVPAQIAVIGGGVAGVELALAMAHRARALTPQVTVIEAATLLPHISPAARRALRAHLDRYGVRVLEHALIVQVAADGVTLADGTQIAASLTVGAAGTRPQGWLAETGLPLTDGYITVDPYLRAQGHDDIFAVGDCAHMASSPRPKAGVFAVRQAPILFHNLRAAVGAGQLQAYHPQKDYLKLVSLGGKSALADKWGLAVQGGWLWRQKDAIDARFMAQFRDPRPMPPALPMPRIGADAAPLCGGCGAKLGAQALRTALGPAPVRADIIAGAGDDAALLRVGDSVQVLATDHLRAIVEDPFTMARIAANHALGDIWAMGARPQAALVNLTLPRMTPPLQARTLAEVMAGLRAVLDPAGAAIIGGHSTMGAEMQIGLTLTGTLDGAPLRKAGAQPGDALILTKALGTGVIMAAEMQWAAAGDIVAGAMAQMLQSQALAAQILRPVARAMTDVTGFGLAGHLSEMLASDALGAEIDLSALPLLPGAEDLAGLGHASSLLPDNRAALGEMLDAPDSARAFLLLDPQTAGGLLAAVPMDQAKALVTELRGIGYAAAAIGHVTATGRIMVR
jgi:selenide, water dikinase